MNVPELKEKIDSVESIIIKTLNDLSDETGIHIESIDLETYTSVLKTGVKITSITDVKITITL